MKEYDREVQRATEHAEKLAKAEAELAAKQGELKAKKASVP
jgi:phage shock protein A